MNASISTLRLGRLSTSQLTTVLASVLLICAVAHAAQPMRLPSGSLELSPGADGIARVPASCTRRDLHAPDSRTVLSVHSDSVKVVRIDHDVEGGPVAMDTAVKNGWIQWPTGVGVKHSG